MPLSAAENKAQEMVLMKVLGIMGSPRIGGNTDLLLQHALEGARSQGAEIEKISVDKMNIQPCREYYHCLKDGNCSIRDDMHGIYIKLVEADIVIVASPMFFYCITAQLKALIDRCQALWSRRYFLKRNVGRPGRKCAFIGIGATRGKNLFEGPILVMKYFSKALDAEYAGELLIRGVDQKAAIKDHPTALQEAYHLGKKLAQSS
jgi:multimeric flavodoxin WrbA